MICVRVDCRRARGSDHIQQSFSNTRCTPNERHISLSSMGFRCSSVGSRPLTWPPPFPVRIKKRSSIESFNRRRGKRFKFGVRHASSGSKLTRLSGHFPQLYLHRAGRHTSRILNPTFKLSCFNLKIILHVIIPIYSHFH